MYEDFLHIWDYFLRNNEIFLAEIRYYYVVAAWNN